MKFFGMIALIGLLVLAGCKTPGPTKSAQMAEYAYATGCLDAYRKLCLRFGDDGKVNACREEGLAECEPAGKKFKSFIENPPGPTSQ